MFTLNRDSKIGSRKRSFGGTWCAVPKCLSNTRTKHVAMFRFPRNPKRCLTWTVNCDRLELIEKGTEHLYKNYRVCSKHFEAQFFTDDRSRLIKEAVPTLFLFPEQSEEDDMSAVSVDQEIVGNVPNPFEVHDTQPVCIEVHDVKDDLELLENRDANRRILTNDLKVPQRKMEVDVKPSSPDEDEDLKRMLTFYEKYFSPTLTNIMNLHVSLLLKSKKGHRFEEYKNFVFTIYFLRPAVYRLLETIIELPTEKSLKQCTRRWNINPGLTPFVFSILKLKFGSLEEKAKDCSLCINEISLRANLFYNISKDEIVGFHHTDQVKAFRPAQFALVLVVKGIRSNWKQEIGYIFSTSSCSGQEFKDLLFTCINYLFQNGCRVQCLISDTATNFFKFACSFDVTPETPYFFVGTYKIMYIFDTHRLLKATRNIFFKHKYVFNGKETNKKYLEEFYNRDKCMRFSTAPKLTEAHVYPTNLQKLDLKYAGQVLSRTVAAALSTYMYLGALPLSAGGTIDFIDSMDKLFDILSSTKISTDKYYKQPFVGAEYQITFLNNMQNYFKHVKVYTRIGKDITKHIRSSWCWQITISAILHLWIDLGKPTLYTAQLNQDCFEKLFCNLRAQQHNLTTATPRQFRYCFKKTFFSSYLQHANSTEDFDKVLEQINTNSLNIIDFMYYEQSLFQRCELKVGDTDYRNLKVPKSDGLIYVGYYLIRKCLKKHDCDVCRNFKDLDFADMYDTDFYEYVRELEETFSNNFSKDCLKQRVGHCLRNKMLTISFRHPCAHFPFEFLVNLFIRYRICTTLKFVNKYLEFQKDGDSKYIKILHL